MVSRPFTTRDKFLSLISDGKPRSTRDVAEQLGLTTRAAEFVCYRYWKMGPVLRSEKPLRERNRTLAGRAGSSYNTRSFYVLGDDREMDCCNPHSPLVIRHFDVTLNAISHRGQLETVPYSSQHLCRVNLLAISRAIINRMVTHERAVFIY